MNEQEAHDERVELRRILAEQGLDDNGFSPHSWRCEHPDRYPDACTCVADIIDAILAAGYRKQPEPEWEYGTALVGASGEIWDEEPSESLEAALEVVAGSNSESTQYPDESPCVVVRRSKWERVEEERG